MKKNFFIILALAMVLCVCSCSPDSNTLSEPIEVEYESIIVNENAEETTDNTSTKTDYNTTQTHDTSIVVTPSQTTDISLVTSSNSAIVVDYNTVVEVDICDDVIRGYLESKNDKNQFYWLKTYEDQKFDNQYLSIDWYLDGSVNYTVYFSENADFSNAIITQTNSSFMRNTVLVPGKTYYWKVIGTITTDVLGGGRIKVKNAPVRWIQVDGVGNVRDMGGWKTENGKTVKYEMIYRGRQLDNATEMGLETIRLLGWKTELDLRYESQKFQKQGTGMNYVFLVTNAQYDGLLFDQTHKGEVQIACQEMFRLMSDENNYPFYIHCSGGADRTGTIAFLINGLLGVSYEDLTRDFELTSFSPSGKRWRADSYYDTDGKMTVSGNYVAWGALYKKMMEYGAKNGCTTLQSSIEYYLANYIGVAQSQIDSFKAIMLQ